MEDFDPSFKTTYSQNREDIILYSLFTDVSKGFYVDVGAGHPTEDSVTKLFYKLGWSGINIDPIKKIHNLLQKDRPRDINLNIGLSNKKSKLKFREYANYGQSTFASSMKKEYQDSIEKQQEYTDYEVDVNTLSNILAEHKIKHIHFLKIDAEGLEYEILEGNDWKKFRPEVICIEANHMVKDWRPILRDNDYSAVFNDGINSYYVSKESSGERVFSYTKAFLGKIRPVDFRVARVVDEKTSGYMSRINNLITENHHAYSLIDRLEYERNVLDDRLIKASSTKVLIKTLYKSINAKIEEAIYPSKQEYALHHIPKDAQITLRSNVLDQLEEINDYDEHNLSKINTSRHRLIGTLRKSLLKLYRVFIKVLVQVVKTSIRVIRKIKRIIKH